LLLTDVDAVYANWGTPAARPLAELTPQQLRHYHYLWPTLIGWVQTHAG
jgi:carbamate kinase